MTTQTDITPALRITGLSKSFGGLRAVQDLHMDLPRGRITALVGPNGAGKTTIYNLVTGILTPDSGTVFLNGRDITGNRPHDVSLSGLGRSFQDLKLFDRMSVIDNLRVAQESASWLWQPGGRAARIRREQIVSEALEHTGLTAHAKERALDLAYAERKFLSLGRLIATGAETWLLDEPTSGLDPASRVRFIQIIRDACAAGTTICLIEHNLDIVTELADWIIFLDQGTKLAEGEPADILHDPALAEVYFGRRPDEQ